VLDGETCILLKTDGDPNSQRADATIKVHEAFVIDVLMSSGEGTPKELEGYTTIFMRNPAHAECPLQTEAARSLLADITEQHPDFPFSLRTFTEEQMAMVRLGMRELVTNQFLQKYEVLCEQEGETVCHLKCTVLVMPDGALKVSGVPLDMDRVKCDKTVTDEALKKLLATHAGRKAKHKNKRKSKKSAPVSTPAPAAALAAATPPS
jgi:methionyl aminopeptidase